MFDFITSNANAPRKARGSFFPSYAAQDVENAIDLVDRVVAREPDPNESVRSMPEPFEGGGCIEIAVRGENALRGEGSTDLGRSVPFEGEGDRWSPRLGGRGSESGDARDLSQAIPEA